MYSLFTLLVVFNTFKVYITNLHKPLRLQQHRPHSQESPRRELTERLTQTREERATKCPLIYTMLAGPVQPPLRPSCCPQPMARGQTHPQQRGPSESQAQGAGLIVVSGIIPHNYLENREVQAEVVNRPLIGSRGRAIY
jgi:hypothetical protein